MTKLWFLIVSVFAVAIAVEQRDSGCGSSHYQLGFSGSFTSMNFDPQNDVRYDNNAKCNWTLETSTTQQQVIELDFDYFHVEGSVNCMYDSVIAYDGLDTTAPVLRTMCGHNLPNPTVGTGHIMYVLFTTDSSVAYTGFSATWRTRNQPVECEVGVGYRCGDDENGYCIPFENRCNQVDDCPNGQDELSCPINSATCGQPAIDPVLNPVSAQVTGGTEAEPYSWPWQVAIQRMFTHQCGGILLDPFWILTAAHCVQSDALNPQLFDIIVGNHIYSQVDPYEEVHAVDEIFVHPTFDMFKDEYNFAMVKMRVPINITANPAAHDICLAPKGANYPNGTKAWVTGWGEDAVGAMRIEIDDIGTTVLQQTEVTIYDDDFCNQPSMHDGAITETLMCAGSVDGTIDACQGDNGGPMVWYNAPNDKWVLVGVVGPRREQCGTSGMPGLYGNVDSVLTWVQSIMMGG
ncbi:plasminogen-like [Saccoglossus kowalevskii]|uniref:Transmembrane protease serine 5-like n=1 Tax=Saccoglossus kowalevskii TaxID=10224 RepID=A0ABM0GRM1_SACKO|nr:PREDICTED: transmembrane protease serine 5-like [Saccoglossus kowalevskii]